MWGQLTGKVLLLSIQQILEGRRFPLVTRTLMQRLKKPGRFKVMFTADPATT
ncbi:hypothetical protein JG687_00012023 [Phytophthora cactorum]|uniref:Uncharacterized protein n=1 Tax=Phytophthora cactorum TaxID=29920 RepID=A0A8T1U2T3_9STRA|nr:hypothetical protein JG687_00012023 [Phytophthora cactorum]